jgi:hypothetical protein
MPIPIWPVAHLSDSVGVPITLVVASVADSDAFSLMVLQTNIKVLRLSPDLLVPMATIAPFEQLRLLAVAPPPPPPNEVPFVTVPCVYARAEFESCGAAII